MRDGIPYEEAARLARAKNPLIVNPSAHWGSSRIWTACKRARSRGLVKIRHINASTAYVYPAQPLSPGPDKGRGG